MDKNGDAVIPPQFKKADAFSHGYAAVSDGSGLYAYIDTKGNLICDYQYETACAFSAAGYAAVQDGFGWTYIDTTGTQLSSIEIALGTEWCRCSDRFDEDTGVAPVYTAEALNAESNSWYYWEYGCLMDKQGRRVGTATFHSYKTAENYFDGYKGGVGGTVVENHNTYYGYTILPYSEFFTDSRITEITPGA